MTKIRDECHLNLWQFVTSLKLAATKDSAQATENARCQAFDKLPHPLEIRIGN